MLLGPLQCGFGSTKHTIRRDFECVIWREKVLPHLLLRGWFSGGKWSASSVWSKTLRTLWIHICHDVQQVWFYLRRLWMIFQSNNVIFSGHCNFYILFEGSHYSWALYRLMEILVSDIVHIKEGNVSIVGPPIRSREWEGSRCHDVIVVCSCLCPLINESGLGRPPNNVRVNNWVWRSDHVDAVTAFHSWL